MSSITVFTGAHTPQGPSASRHTTYTIRRQHGDAIEATGRTFREAIETLRTEDLSVIILDEPEQRQLDRAVLNGTNLDHASLRHCRLSHADLTQAVLRAADLRGAVLRSAVLTGAVLDGANLCPSVLDGADLDDASLITTKLHRASLIGACLIGAKLENADLRDADLRRANLAHASLPLADLTGADLRGADLTEANLCAAIIDGADFTGANLTGARMPRGFRYADAEEALELDELLKAIVKTKDTRGAVQNTKDRLRAELTRKTQRISQLNATLSLLDCLADVLDTLRCEVELENEEVES